MSVGRFWWKNEKSFKRHIRDSGSVASEHSVSETTFLFLREGGGRLGQFLHLCRQTLSS